MSSEGPVHDLGEAVECCETHMPLEDDLRAWWNPGREMVCGGEFLVVTKVLDHLWGISLEDS
jgi:hypothetical protein